MSSQYGEFVEQVKKTTSAMLSQVHTWKNRVLRWEHLPGHGAPVHENQEA